MLACAVLTGHTSVWLIYLLSFCLGCVFTVENPARLSFVTELVGGALIPMFLARRHEQEPPPEQLRGSPRHAFPVTEQQMTKAIELLKKHDVDFEGPVDHPEVALVKRSLYFKDPSSNFLELCVPRED